MRPLNFEGAVLKKTDDYKSETFTNMDLPVTITEYKGEQISQSIWELSDEEMELLLKERKIVLTVWANNYPPVGLHVFDKETAVGFNFID